MNRAIFAALLLAGCSAGVDPGPGNAQRESQPGRPTESVGPCAAPLSRSAYASCDFGPAEPMRGVWVTGFERSGFVANATEIPDVDDPAPSRIWLAFAPNVYPDPALRAELDKLRATGAAAIDFIGRRSRGPNAERVVLVERIISMRILGPLQRR